MKYRVMVLIPKAEGYREDLFEQKWAYRDSLDFIQEIAKESEASVFQDVVEAVRVAEELSYSHIYDYVTIVPIFE